MARSNHVPYCACANVCFCHMWISILHNSILHASILATSILHLARIEWPFSASVRILSRTPGNEASTKVAMQISHFGHAKRHHPVIGPKWPCTFWPCQNAWSTSGTKVAMQIWHFDRAKKVKMSNLHGHFGTRSGSCILARSKCEILHLVLWVCPKAKKPKRWLVLSHILYSSPARKRWLVLKSIPRPLTLQFCLEYTASIVNFCFRCFSFNLANTRPS